MVVFPPSAYLRILPPGGPIWWDSPRPADLIGWAKAGCPTAEKPGKKRKADEEGEAWRSVGAPWSSVELRGAPWSSVPALP